MIKKDVIFETTQDKIEWVQREINNARVYELYGVDQSLRNYYVKTILEFYKPKFQDMYSFKYDMLNDTTLKNWLEIGGGGEFDGGIPSFMTKEGEGLYSFELLKPKFNEMWM